MTVTLPDRFISVGAKSHAEEEVSRLVQDVTGKSLPVEVQQLKGGITNQLLLATQDGVRMLVRAFGKGTDTFINRKLEFAVHSQLTKLGLAPTLFGQFGNGLIYGYIPGTPAEARILNEKPVMRDVSRRLAQWHAVLKPAAVAQSLKPEILGDLWFSLEKWVRICPPGVLPLSPDDLLAEFEWIKRTLSDRGGDHVMGHCDLLSANILLSSSEDGALPPAPLGTPEDIAEKITSHVAFIDYEYATPCPRAFDIANHFQEWQGYECEKQRVPTPVASSEDLRFWCTHYLDAYALLTNTDSDFAELVKELQAWWGMPGFYWGVWSAIQSKTSDIEFGYHDYAINRFSEYTAWKKAWTQAKTV